MNYRKLCVEDDELRAFPKVPLFSEDESSRAETILTALEGMSIISAHLLLNKCKQAVEQSEFRR